MQIFLGNVRAKLGHLYMLFEAIAYFKAFITTGQHLLYGSIFTVNSHFSTWFCADSGWRFVDIPASQVSLEIYWSKLFEKASSDLDQNNLSGSLIL